MVFTLLLNGLMFALFIWAAVEFFSQSRRKPFITYGYFFATIIVLADLVIVFLTPESFATISEFLLISEVFTFFKIVIYMAIGTTLTLQMGHPTLPLIRWVRGHNLHFQPVKYSVRILFYVMIMLVFTFLLFQYSHPHYIEQNSYSRTTGFAVLFSFFIIAISEEIVFRQGLQTLLASKFKFKGGYALAVLITSVVWTLGHLFIIEPAWIKVVQILPFGILLGFLFRKQGLESTMLVHGIFNVLIVALEPFLLK